MGILYQPKMGYEDFVKWFNSEPVWHRMQIENVTARDMGVARKSLIGNKVTLVDIYNEWYLARHNG